MWKPEVEEINDIPKTLVGKIAKQEIRKHIKKYIDYLLSAIAFHSKLQLTLGIHGISGRKTY